MALFVMKLMSFIPSGDVCEQYKLRQKTAAKSALTTPLFSWFLTGVRRRPMLVDRM
jgi:hypothetical protein